MNTFTLILQVYCDANTYYQFYFLNAWLLLLIKTIATQFWKVQYKLSIELC